MSKNYRDIYEGYYGVRLKCGISSIHHLNWIHGDSNPENLVAITQHLHNKINIYVEEFPRLIKLFSKCCIYNKLIIKQKNLLKLKEYIDIVIQLNQYVKIRNVIKIQGVQEAVNIFGKDVIEEIYDIERTI